MYVASDLPLVVALAHGSPSLRGRALTAGNHTGLIGNVFSSHLCSEEELRLQQQEGAGGGEPPACAGRALADPGGSWTRSVVDLFLLSRADVLFRVGGRFQRADSGFAHAAEAVAFPGPGRVQLVDWGFSSPLTAEGRYLEPEEARRADRWGSPRATAVSEAIAGLEAAGLGGSGV